METAYVAMFVMFAVAAVLGALIPRRGVAIVCAMAIFLASVAAFMIQGHADWQTFVFASPFLVAMAIVYAFICNVGVRLGRRLRFGKQDARASKA
jgi:hypothetical protein